MEKLDSYLEIPIIKKRDPFCLKSGIYVRFGSCFYFPSKVLHKVYRKKLRNYDPGN